MSSAFHQWFIRFGFRIGIGILVLVGLLYYSQKRNLDQSLSWVHHSSQVQKKLDHIVTEINRDLTSKSALERVEELRQETNDNPLQRQRLEELKVLLEKNHLKSLSSEDQLSLRDQVFRNLAAIHAEESRLHAEREQSSRKKIDLLDLPIALGGLFACFLIFMANRITRQEFQHLLQKDRELEKQAYELRASRDRSEIQNKIMTSTLESMVEGVILVNENRQFLQFNTAAREHLGLVGKNIHDPEVMAKFVRKNPKTMEELPLTETPVSKALRGESTINEEVLVSSDDIEPKILSFNGRPILDETGKNIGAIVVFRDVTQARTLEGELRKAEKSATEAADLKSRFLANMSHEIRTPMNGIIGMTEILSHTDLDEKQESYLNLINSSCQSLLTIINDILDFSKIEAGKLEIEKNDFHLSYAIDRSVQLLAPKAREKNLVLLSYISPEIPENVRGDSGRLGQVLVNILSNAIKFTEQGQVTVFVEPVPSTDHFCELKFTVEDTGVGLNAKEAEKLFLPFSQADASTSRRFGGTGLGLSICKQLVDLMGGSIGVLSQPGKGSQFSFVLPFEKPISNASERHERKMTSHNQVLIFDEDPLSAKILYDYTKSWGLDVQHIKTIEEFKNWSETKSDFSKSDVFLVGVPQNLTALQKICQNLQKNEKRPRLTLIVDQENQDVFDQFRAAGVQDFLTRPLDQSSLYNHLMQAMSEELNFSGLLDSVRFQAMVSATPSSYRILLAEDNTVNQLIAQAFIKELGFSVHTVANGLEVLEAMKTTEFDLILMDCQMPEMDGYQASQFIRANVSKTIPIVALTANAMKGDEDKCLNAGMSDYLAKPFKKAHLQSILQKHLSSKSEPEFNFAQLEMYKGYQDENGEDLRKALIESYLQNATTACHELLQSFRLDQEKFHRLAHSLKSSTASVGGAALARLFQSLESEPLSEVEIQNRLSVVPQHFQELKVKLDQYLKSIG